ncbi:MAG: FMN-binding protein [Solirubrobacteraceae bacterium]
MKLVRRIAGTAALVAVTVVLVAIYLRSEGKGAPLSALAATGSSASRSGASSPKSSGSGSSSGSSGSKGGSSEEPKEEEPSGNGEEARASEEASGSGKEAGASGGGASSSKSGGAGAGKGSGASKGSSEGAHAASRTVTSPVVQTPYGPVQLAVAAQGSRIVDVKALQLPTEHSYSLYISERVAPILRTEALKAQSAEISIVSGATFTSEGFATSLQRALSKLG